MCFGMNAHRITSDILDEPWNIAILAAGTDNDFGKYKLGSLSLRRWYTNKNETIRNLEQFAAKDTLPIPQITLSFELRIRE